MGQTIHLIFKTHLDIGFTDSAAGVIQNYFSNYIPLRWLLHEKYAPWKEPRNLSGPPVLAHL